MDASITLQRPRPQNLFVSNPNTTSDLKCSTAALKPISGEWSSISLRSIKPITSATLKKASSIDSDPKSATALAQEYKDQIAAILLQKKHQTPKASAPQVIEVPSEGESEGSRVLSPGNSSSETKNSADFSRREFDMMLDKSKSDVEEVENKKTSELLNEKIATLNKELEDSSKLITEKDKEILALKAKIEIIPQCEKEIEALKNILEQLKDENEKSIAYVREEEGQKVHQAQEQIKQLEEKIYRLEVEIQGYKDLQSRLEASEAEKNQLLDQQRSIEEELNTTKRALEETTHRFENEINQVKSQYDHLMNELESQKQYNQELIAEKSSEIERLHDIVQKIADEKNQESHEKQAAVADRDSLRDQLGGKDAEIKSVIHEKEELKKSLEAELQNKIRELNDQKSELENIKAKYDCIGQESADVKIFLDEKTQKIISLEAEIRTLVQEQENSSKVLQQIHEAKVFLNEFNQKLQVSPQDELMPAIQCLIQEFTNTQAALKEESKRIKDQQESVDQANQRAEDMKKEVEDLKASIADKVHALEEKAENDLENSKRAFLEKVDDLEREKSELHRALDETKEHLNKSTSDFENVKAELDGMIHKLQNEKKNLLEQLEESENVAKNAQLEVQKKDHEIKELKAAFEKEKSLLQFELNEYKQQTSNVSELKDENQTFRNTVNELNNSQLKLQETLDEITQKLEASNKEVAELKLFKKTHKDIDSAEVAQLREENANLLKKLEESTETYSKAIGEFEEKLVAKDQYIEALIFDVNQMKEFIVDHHGEAIFEKDEKEHKEEITQEALEAKLEIQQLPEETVPEAVEAKEEEVVAPAAVIAETKEEVVVPETKHEEAPKEAKKVVVIVEKPVYKRYDSYYKGGYGKDSYRGGYDRNYDRGYYGGYKKFGGRSYRSHKDDYYYNSNKRDYQVEETVPEPEPVQEVKEVKPEVKPEVKQDKWLREEDPAYRQLEKMVIELNEKLIQSERRAKKMVEEKMEEVAKSNEEKEAEFLARIEKVEEEKKALLKKIDDIQWDRAYEYTEKQKAEKKEEANKTEATAASLNAKKKKNKK